MILGLLVMITSVSSITAVVAEFVFVLAGHIGVLEVTVVFLLVGRWRIFAIRNNSGHNGTQNQNLQNIYSKLIQVNTIKSNSTLNFKNEIKKKWNKNFQLTTREVFMSEEDARQDCEFVRRQLSFL